MKTIAAVFADFVEGPLGGPSALLEPLLQQRVIDHTLRRLCDIRHVTNRCLVVQRRDAEAAEHVLRSAGIADRIDLLAIENNPRPQAALIRAARRWGGAAWRGTPLSTTWFDEFVDPLSAAQVLERYAAEAVLCVDAHQSAFDPQLATDMVEHQRRHLDDAKMVFTPAPPGACGILLRRELVGDLIEGQFPVGMLLSYRPEIPQPDPLTRPVCMPVAPRIAATTARLTADTKRGRELLAGALAACGLNAGAATICDWVSTSLRANPEPLPVEVEIELTTADLLPDTTLRLRGARVPARHLTDLAGLERIASELATYDDRRVMIGGFGDPLLHPEFPRICRILRDSGVASIGVATHLVECNENTIEALFSVPVDLVQVRIDAHSAAAYQQVHRAALFDRVVENVMNLERTRQTRSAPRPIVLCSLTRCAATIDEMEVFYDHWMRTLGGALIEGYETCGGAMPSDTLIPLTPPIRRPCRRIERRMLLLADGRVPACSQDHAGQMRLGDWRSDSLSDLWHGEALLGLRERHRAGEWQALPVCAKCDAWFRP